MKKLLVILVLSLLAGVACSESEKPPQPDPPKKEDPTPPDEPDGPDIPLGNGAKVDIPHYIMGFILPKDFRAYKYFGKIDFFAIIDIWVDECDGATYNSSEEKRQAAYEALCTKYGDTTYNNVRSVELLGRVPQYYYLGVDIVSIDLVADQAWGDRPAGSSLADLCTLVATTPRDYISSGYTGEYDWSQDSPYFTPYQQRLYAEMFPERKPVVKKLSECEASDLRLISDEEGFNVCSLYLPDAPPQQPGEPYRFTVIITLEDGRVFEVPA